MVYSGGNFLAEDAGNSRKGPPLRDSFPSLSCPKARSLKIGFPIRVLLAVGSVGTDVGGGLYTERAGSGDHDYSYNRHSIRLALNLCSIHLSYETKMCV